MVDSKSGISLEEYLKWEDISHSWAQALDDKDWDLLHAILAPKVTIDYLECFGWIDKDITAEQYVTKCCGPNVLGPTNRKTQHIFGASKVKKINSTTATACRQIKAQNYLFDSLAKQEIAKSHGYGTLQFFYGKVDNHWKLVGLKAVVDFMEGDMQAVYPTYPKFELQL